MKILTKAEEDAHYATVLKYGSVGGALGVGGSWAGLMLASRRWALIKNLTLPMKGFIVSSVGAASLVIAADSGTRAFNNQNRREIAFLSDRHAQLRNKEAAEMSRVERLADWARRERYKLLGVTWVATMIGSWAFVGRNPYLTKQQKLVQARVYAQGLTLAVLCGSAAFEMHDRRQNKKGFLDSVDVKKTQKQEHPRTDDKDEDLWKDMVAAEEKRLEGNKK